MLEATFKDNQDCYEIKLVLAKPGVPSKFRQGLSEGYFEF